MKFETNADMNDQFQKLMYFKTFANKRCYYAIGAKIELVETQEDHAVFSFEHKEIKWQFLWYYHYGDDYFPVLIEYNCIKLLKYLLNQKR